MLVRQKRNSVPDLIIMKAHTGLIEKALKYLSNFFMNFIANEVKMGLKIGSSH